jgi:hypothetical protein
MTLTSGDNLHIIETHGAGARFMASNIKSEEPTARRDTMRRASVVWKGLLDRLKQSANRSLKIEPTDV